MLKMQELSPCLHRISPENAPSCESQARISAATVGLNSGGGHDTQKRHVVAATTAAEGVNLTGSLTPLTDWQGAALFLPGRL
jgi:hypothetical protein